MAAIMPPAIAPAPPALLPPLPPPCETTVAERKGLLATVTPDGALVTKVEGAMFVADPTAAEMAAAAAASGEPAALPAAAGSGVPAAVVAPERAVWMLSVSSSVGALPRFTATATRTPCEPGPPRRREAGERKAPVALSVTFTTCTCPGSTSSNVAKLCEMACRIAG